MKVTYEINDVRIVTQDGRIEVSNVPWLKVGTFLTEREIKNLELSNMASEADIHGVLVRYIGNRVVEIVGTLCRQTGLRFLDSKLYCGGESLCPGTDYSDLDSRITRFRRYFNIEYQGIRITRVGDRLEGRYVDRSPVPEYIACHNSLHLVDGVVYVGSRPASVDDVFSAAKSVIVGGIEYSPYGFADGYKPLFDTRTAWAAKYRHGAVLLQITYTHGAIILITRNGVPVPSVPLKPLTVGPVDGLEHLLQWLEDTTGGAND